MVTESIILEEIATGWLRVTIVWSPLMGFVYPLESSIKAVDVGYIWRSSGTHWSAEEEETIREHYPNTPRTELMHLLPSRSWLSIVAKAGTMEVVRQFSTYERFTMPKDMSVTDTKVISEFMLDVAAMTITRSSRVEWRHDYIYPGLSNGDTHSRQFS